MSPAPWRTYTSKVLGPRFFNPAEIIQGKTWEDSSTFEKWSVISWIFVNPEGCYFFAPVDAVLEDFGIPEEGKAALKALYPCMNPGRCGALFSKVAVVVNAEGPLGHEPCSMCGTLAAILGQAWNLDCASAVDIIHTRLWAEHRLKGMLSHQPGGHSSPCHICGQSCGNIRGNAKDAEVGGDGLCAACSGIAAGKGKGYGKSGDWICGRCHTNNFAKRRTCFRCGDQPSSSSRGH
jgi:hypothetical protein